MLGLAQFHRPDLVLGESSGTALRFDGTINAVVTFSYAMRFAVSSSSGQVIAIGSLFIQLDEAGEQRLSFCTERGRIIEGGVIDADGDLAYASQVLLRQFFETWGVAGITLTSR
jgi:hypothetical protein